MPVSESFGARILVIDHDPAFCGFLRDVLTENGYQAFVANDGATGAARLEEIRPDLIILDLMLPDIDGLLLCSDLTRAAVPVSSAAPRTGNATAFSRSDSGRMISFRSPSTFTSSRRGYPRFCGGRVRPARPARTFSAGASGRRAWRSAVRDQR
jgi:chemotaxis response regulator CheB